MAVQKPHTDIQQTIDEIDMAESNSAASRSKLALSSLEKESNAKDHPDFHAKNKIRTHHLLLRKMDIVTFF